MIEAADKSEVETDAACEAIVRNWARRPAIRTEIKTETRVYYRPSTDSVHLPARFRFVDTAHYYSTLFHELVHSTGHPSRLSRDFGKLFGDELYSKEELIAETGAAFLCAIAQIATERTERKYEFLHKALDLCSSQRQQADDSGGGRRPASRRPHHRSEYPRKGRGEAGMRRRECDSAGRSIVQPLDAGAAGRDRD